MRQYYILVFLAISMLFTGCSKEEPPYFDASANGVYFNYSSTDNLNASVNFGQYPLEKPEELTVSIKLKALGYKPEKSQKVILKSKAVDNYPEAEVILPEVVFESGEMEKTIEVKVKHPAEMGTEYASCIYIDSEDENSEFGEGINGYGEFTVYVSESYQEPSTWNPYGNMCFGEWTVQKHLFLVDVTANNNYANTQSYQDWARYNLTAVNSLRKYQDENPGATVDIAIPFLTDGYANYPKPSYWNTIHDKYFGSYQLRTFVSLCSACGINTSNEYTSFNGSEDNIKELNKVAVSGMMDTYDQLFGYQYPGIYYRNQSWIPLVADIDYNVKQPACWQDPECGAMLEKYYGSYSDSKYKFMIKAWLNHIGQNNFVLVQMFPVFYAWDGQNAVAAWDDSLNGEQQIKDCYTVFKTEYDKNPGAYDFIFPDVTLN